MATVRVGDLSSKVDHRTRIRAKKRTRTQIEERRKTTIVNAKNPSGMRRSLAGYRGVGEATIIHMIDRGLTRAHLSEDYLIMMNPGMR